MTDVTRRVQWWIFLQRALLSYFLVCVSPGTRVMMMCKFTKIKASETKLNRLMMVPKTLRGKLLCRNIFRVFTHTEKICLSILSESNFSLNQSMIVGSAANILEIKTPANYRLLLLHVFLKVFKKFIAIPLLKKL